MRNDGYYIQYRYEQYAQCGVMAVTDWNMYSVHILCECTDTTTVMSSLLCVSGWMRQIEAMYLCEWMNASERRHVLCVGVPHIQHMCSVRMDMDRCNKYQTCALCGSMDSTDMGHDL